MESNVSPAKPEVCSDTRSTFSEISSVFGKDESQFGSIFFILFSSGGWVAKKYCSELIRKTCVREVTGTCRFQFGTNGIAANSFEGTTDSFRVAGKLNRGSISKEFTLPLTAARIKEPKNPPIRPRTKSKTPRARIASVLLSFFFSFLLQIMQRSA